MQLNDELGQLKLQRNYDYSRLKYIKYIKIHEFKMTKKKKVPHQPLLQDAGKPILHSQNMLNILSFL